MIFREGLLASRKSHVTSPNEKNKRKPYVAVKPNCRPWLTPFPSSPGWPTLMEKSSGTIVDGSNTQANLYRKCKVLVGRVFMIRISCPKFSNVGTIRLPQGS